MRRKNVQFFESLFFISDLLVISVAWMLSNFLKCETTLIKPPLLVTISFVHNIEGNMGIGFKRDESVSAEGACALF